MHLRTKNKLEFIIQIVVLVLVSASALTGPIISLICQYTWWNLIALIWIPYGIYLVAWNRKANEEMTADERCEGLNKVWEEYFGEQK